MHTIRALLVRFTLVSALLGTILSSSIQATLAGSASATGDGLHPVKLTVSNGRVTFDTCKGTCSAADTDPASAGPVRPWQTAGPAINRTMQTFTLTGKGIQTSLVDSRGQTQSYTGLPSVVCFNYTSDEATAAGGRTRLQVAYWDPTLTNCDDDWALACKPVKGNWYVLKTTYDTGEACALLRLTGSYALVRITGP